jgi:signal transduction histidine kinase
MDLLAGEESVPLRVRAVVAAVPTALAAISLAVDPTWPVALGLLVAVSPWLLQMTRYCLGWPYAGLLTLASVAWLMSRWRTTDIALMLLVFYVGQSAMLHARRLALTVLAACLAVPIGWQIGSAYSHMGAWILGMAMAFLSGAALRAQQLTVGRLEAAQAELASRAVADERRRIAREVHDLAAHSMAVTMLHLTGARLALADGEIAEAESALGSAERLGRSSLDEIRRAVGVLAEPEDAGSRRPEPGADDIGRLVEDYRRAGVAVAFTSHGSAAQAGRVTGLALFRLAQESLANAARHAPGAPVTMHVEWCAADVTLVVVNPFTGPVQRRGHGLLGMRERVEQLGGEFSSGPVGTEWQVRARLPCDAPALEPR